MILEKKENDKLIILTIEMVFIRPLVIVSVLFGMTSSSSAPSEEYWAYETQRPRNLMHMHIQPAKLYGNSTDLQYFYSNVFVGSAKQKEALIIDTGSGITAFPCKQSCRSCGNHINEYFDLDNSATKKVYDCTLDGPCQCQDDKCAFTQGYGEGSSYRGYLVEDDFYFGA